MFDVVSPRTDGTQRETLSLPPGFRDWCMGQHGNTTVEEVRRRHSNKTVHLSSPYLAPGHHVVGNLCKYDEEGTQRKLPNVEMEDNNSVYDAVGRYCLIHSMSATAVCGVRQPKPIKRSRGTASGPAKAAGSRAPRSRKTAAPLRSFIVSRRKQLGQQASTESEWTSAREIYGLRRCIIRIPPTTSRCQAGPQMSVHVRFPETSEQVDVPSASRGGEC